MEMAKSRSGPRSCAKEKHSSGKNKILWHPKSFLIDSVRTKCGPIGSVKAGYRAESERYRSRLGDEECLIGGKYDWFVWALGRRFILNQERYVER